MSVYSGFATRKLETIYNQGVCRLISLLQQSLISLIQEGNKNLEKIDVQRLSISFQKIYRSLKSLEQQKHHEPKFSIYCEKLAVCLPFDKSDLPHAHSNHNISNSEIDFHLLNDMLGYDNSRAPTPGKFIKSRIKPIIHGKISKIETLSRKISKKFVLNDDRVPRASSTKIINSEKSVRFGRSNSFLSIGRKTKKLRSGKLLQKDAVDLIYDQT
jgi:hypothetical protein